MKPNHETRILVVEDEALVAEMIQGLLEENDYQVVGRASTGQQGISLACTLHPDVVLMDIALPDMDGLEATQRIYTCCPVPVVALTAYDAPELVRRASATGIVAYLVKPTTARELERALIVALARFEDLLALRQLNAELQARNAQLQTALAQVKTLRGMLPICASCKKVRDDKGYWRQVEEYVREHTEVEFTHGLCPDCMRRLYPEFADSGS